MRERLPHWCPKVTLWKLEGLRVVPPHMISEWPSSKFMSSLYFSILDSVVSPHPPTKTLMRMSRPPSWLAWNCLTQGVAARTRGSLWVDNVRYCGVHSLGQSQSVSWAGSHIVLYIIRSKLRTVLISVYTWFSVKYFFAILRRLEHPSTRLKGSRLVTFQTPMLARPLLPFQVPEACELLAGSYLWRICEATTFCSNSPNSQFPSAWARAILLAILQVGSARTSAISTLSSIPLVWDVPNWYPFVCQGP